MTLQKDDKIQLIILISIFIIVLFISGMSIGFLIGHERGSRICQEILNNASKDLYGTGINLSNQTPRIIKQNNDVR